MKLYVSIILLLQASFVMSSPLIEDGTEDIEGKYDNVHKLSFINGIGAKTHCSGTIINDYTILSAGHCFADFSSADKLLLKIGSEKLSVESINIPTKFWKNQFHLVNAYGNKQRLTFSNPRPIDYDLRIKALDLEITKFFKKVAYSDLSLIVLKSKISKKLKRTVLNFKKVSARTKTISAGFGYTEYSQARDIYLYPNKLHFIETNIFSNDKVMVVIGNESKEGITTSGDSGGPLLLDRSGEQIGVLSGAGQIIPNNPGMQSIYTPLHSHRAFILKHKK
jgi:secreted trypsin-like serine protease